MTRDAGAPGLYGRTITNYLALLAAALMLAPAARAAPAILEQQIQLSGSSDYVVTRASLAGDEILDFRVNGQRSQILSVDLQADNSSLYFNILPVDSELALFTGSTSGAVADVSLPESGEYRIRVYLTRAAARRDEKANLALGVGLGSPEYADWLSGGPDYWAVDLGAGETLNLRKGPSTRYGVAGVLRTGEPLQNLGCRMSGPERWCRVRSTGSGLAAWAAGRYLREGPAPGRPANMPGGPEGNGLPFDATGYIPCRKPNSDDYGQCPFGVIREGQGNAGVWLVTLLSVERHLLFEHGRLVAVSPGESFEAERRGDETLVLLGDGEYVIPDALIFGG